MAGNTNLHAANKAKKDEFYTQLEDIEKELVHYSNHFRDKTVFCNCDDPYESNFFQYFAMNFNALGLKKLICTCYAGSPFASTQLSLPLFGPASPTGNQQKTRVPHKIEITFVQDFNGDGAVDMVDVEYLLRNYNNVLTTLNGNGSFDSPECTALLDEADIVVTNPPFSKFRDYVKLLMDKKKSFLIIGNQNAITYKEIFPLLMANRIWLGINCVRWFIVPSNYNMKTKLNAAGQRIAEGARSRWFTNLDHKNRHVPMPLGIPYNPSDYPKYDNYDAINVDETDKIPVNYDGVMGVPITFLDKYCPEQFELCGCTESEGKGFSNGLWNAKSKIAQPLINSKKVYKRLFIKRKKY